MSPLKLFIHRFRRPLAAASAGAAVLIVATSLRPAEPPMASAVIAAVDLPAGSTLTPDDLAMRDIPLDYVAPGALKDLALTVGHTVSSGISAGEVITESRLITTAPRADGLLTVPVRLADEEVAGLLQPGSLVDLVQASGGMGQRVIAEGVLIVTVPRRSNSSAFGASSRTAGSLIVVATDRRSAVDLAAAGTQAGLGVVLR